jgi:hypothetical protein
MEIWTRLKFLVILSHHLGWLDLGAGLQRGFTEEAHSLDPMRSGHAGGGGSLPHSPHRQLHNDNLH